MRDVAVVGFAQRQMKELDGSPTCLEILVPIIGELYEQTGWTKSDIGFWCSGSSDYLAGRSFSFVSALGIGTAIYAFYGFAMYLMGRVRKAQPPSLPSPPAST